MFRAFGFHLHHLADSGSVGNDKTPSELVAKNITDLRAESQTPAAAATISPKRLRESDLHAEQQTQSDDLCRSVLSHIGLVTPPPPQQPGPRARVDEKCMRGCEWEQLAAIEKNRRGRISWKVTERFENPPFGSPTLLVVHYFNSGKVTRAGVRYFLRRHFSDMGEVRCFYKGHSYVYIEFADENDAKRAVEFYGEPGNKLYYNGATIEVELQKDTKFNYFVVPGKRNHVPYRLNCASSQRRPCKNSERSICGKEGPVAIYRAVIHGRPLGKRRKQSQMPQFPHQHRQDAIKTST